ncbi:CAP domain-containing protein [Phenylobacterium sp.]|jgi:uncharacterized protein YkwD|uniref:CAP domain-containing protein n=1 Tax=Phenylobacterium sp. TaxID=1871053 RepID=UPI002F418461
MRTARLPLLGLLLICAAPTAALADAFEDAVLAELNHVRAHPAAYARELGDETGNADAYEDPDAVDDAIGFLLRQAPLPPLAANSRMAAAALAHVRAQGPRGDVGHGAPGALGRRLQSQGVFAGLAAETISYGQPSPRAVVRQLVVDSGVPSRAHRKDLFGQAFQAAGVACGRHAVYGGMCVIDFAGALVRR